MRPLLFAMIALAAVLPAVAARAQAVWEMPTEYPASAIPGEGVAMFARLVSERSGGRHVSQGTMSAAAGKWHLNEW